MLARSQPLLALAVAAAVIATAAACGGSGDGTKTFDEDGFNFTFTYPGEFETAENVEFSTSAGGTAKERAAIALDSDNLIAVTRFDLKVSVTKANLAQVKSELDSVIGQVAKREVAGKQIEIGGFPGYEYEFGLAEPATGRSRFVVLFDGKTEYTVNCQSTESKRDELLAGCREALETLEKKS